jgi:FlaA1/EpsC-like NDP-sugar epimerase
MRHHFQATMPEVADKIKFFIGDVRDLASVKNAMHGVDYIFHAAALKQVRPASSSRLKPLRRTSSVPTTS